MRITNLYYFLTNVSFGVRCDIYLAAAKVLFSSFYFLNNEIHFEICIANAIHDVTMFCDPLYKQKHFVSSATQKF